MLQPQPGERGSVTGAVTTAGADGEQKLRSVGGELRSRATSDGSLCQRMSLLQSREEFKLLQFIHIPSSCQAATKLRGVMPRVKKHFNPLPLSLRGRERGKYPSLEH